MSVSCSYKVSVVFNVYRYIFLKAFGYKVPENYSKQDQSIHVSV